MKRNSGWFAGVIASSSSAVVGRAARMTIALALLAVVGSPQLSVAQTATNPLSLFQNYFVTGDYVVAGWREGLPDGSGYAPGTIKLPDDLQPPTDGVPQVVPAGADIVAAYLFWATVESNQSSFAGKQAFFNNYPITGLVLGNPNAPTSWSSGGCSGAANGSKTMRTYRADVRPYLPLDLDPTSPTFGAFANQTSIPVRLADSGSNGNTAPNALGASLVLIYRVLSPTSPRTNPLNAIVIYDGAFAPSNTTQNVSQDLSGFYEPAASPLAKITHIVANGQANKNETVMFGSHTLTSLYGPSVPPFPGLYGTWDNPTWTVGGFVNGGTPDQVFDKSENTSIVPTSSNSGCVSWGVMIFSTTVQDSDNDGLLDTWEHDQGYSNVVKENNPPDGKNDPTSGQWVALPGANPQAKDLFVEVDYLTDLSPNAIPGTTQHSHLPKKGALDAVAAALAPDINVHFDLGAGIYQGDANVIDYSALPPPPAGTIPPQPDAGGNAILESTLLCSDGTTLCAFPNQPAVGWKGDFVNLQNSPSLGKFQPGRGQSYHYILFGHSLGAPRSFWSTLGSPINTAQKSVQVPQLDSISVTSTASSNTTIILHSPQGIVKPGDCTPPKPLVPPAVCSDANNSRLTITGAITQPLLNGTYSFTSKNVSSTTENNVTKTTITVTTTGVAPGLYSFSADPKVPVTGEPQLAVAYLGPTSTSGHSDFGGGGDSAVTLGLWGADDDVTTCIADPAGLQSGQVACDNQVGTLLVQTGTLLHELGHSLALTHGGTYYRNKDPNNQSLPTYEDNCKPNFVSVMNYLFQVRGFVENSTFGYSRQQMSPLDEASLIEGNGIGMDLFGQPSQHLTRWYSMPNDLDKQLQATTNGTRYAMAHCDGTPLLPNEPPSVRVDGTLSSDGTFSVPLDWNNDLVVGDDPIQPPGEDLNHNGVLGGAPFSGFDDWDVVDAVGLQQIGARASSFGSSYAGGLVPKGGGLVPKGGGTDDDGGGLVPKGGGLVPKGGGVDQDENTATSTVNEPSALNCKVPQSGLPFCVPTSPVGWLENAKAVPLMWTAPNFGQIRTYYVWRAVGTFNTAQLILKNRTSFTNIAKVTNPVGNKPPSPMFTDPNVKNGVTYTYFVTDGNLQGAQSPASIPLVVTVKF